MLFIVTVRNLLPGSSENARDDPAAVEDKDR